METIQEKAGRYQVFYRGQLLDDVMPFWMNSDLLDREYGGCITSIDHPGCLRISTSFST